MNSTLGQLFEGVEQRLDSIEEKLDEILDLARIQGLDSSFDPPEDPEAYATGRWDR